MHHACRVQGLKQHADDPDFQQQWREVKQQAKTKAMARVAELSGVQVRIPRLHPWGVYLALSLSCRLSSGAQQRPQKISVDLLADGLLALRTHGSLCHL